MKKMYGTGCLSAERKRKAMIFLLCGIIIIGAIFGTAIYCISPARAETLTQSFITEGFLKTNQIQTLGNVFSNAFKNTAIAILALFCMGFCAIAQPFEFSIPFVRGLALGLAISSVYAQYGLKGFFITFLMILPHAVISSITLMLATREAISFSNSFSGFAFSKKSTEGVRSEIKLYTVKFAVLLFMAFLSAAIDCIATYIFTSLLLK